MPPLMTPSSWSSSSTCQDCCTRSSSTTRIHIRPYQPEGDKDAIQQLFVQGMQWNIPISIWNLIFVRSSSSCGDISVVVDGGGGFVATTGSIFAALLAGLVALKLVVAGASTITSPDERINLSRGLALYHDSGATAQLAVLTLLGLGFYLVQLGCLSYSIHMVFHRYIRNSIQDEMDDIENVYDLFLVAEEESGSDGISRRRIVECVGAQQKQSNQSEDDGETESQSAADPKATTTSKAGSDNDDPPADSAATGSKGGGEYKTRLDGKKQHQRDGATVIYGRVWMHGSGNGAWRNNWFKSLKTDYATTTTISMAVCPDCS